MSTTITIPSGLAAAATKNMERNGFKTLESYIAHLLEKDTKAMDEAAVKERLRSLGYLE